MISKYSRCGTDSGSPPFRRGKRGGNDGVCSTVGVSTSSRPGSLSLLEVALMILLDLLLDNASNFEILCILYRPSGQKSLESSPALALL